MKPEEGGEGRFESFDVQMRDREICISSFPLLFIHVMAQDLDLQS